MNDSDHPLRQGLAPVARPTTRLLILGSLPGEASLAAGQYYAHPRNAFWPVIGHLIGEPDLRQQPYAQRLQRLLEHDIGLWDVIGSARRKGSLDQALREVEANPLTVLLAELPELEAVAFNGQTAFKLGRKLVPPGISVYALPSTSPAHTLTLEQKLAAWSMLARHVS